MKILIIGGAGFLGQKLAHALAKRGVLRGQEISALTLADITMPAPVPAAFPIETLICDITDPTSIQAALTRDVDVVFHLAAIVSGQAEEDFDLGLVINLMGTLNVLNHARALGHCPVVLFASSLAVYGGEVPDPIGDHSFLNPQTSYGAQKAMGELLINDMSRKGFIDGRALRLPTISVRPGKPNRAASSFMSSILREPLQGKEAICPVDPEFAHYYLSPRRCIENLIKGAEIPAQELGQNRAMLMPGRMWRIADLIDAMTAVAGPEPAKLIRWEKQEEIERIVNGWRYDMRPQKSVALGLQADESFQDNIRYFLEDDIAQG